MNKRLTLYIMIGMVLGGYLADTIGWRWAFVVVGTPGIVLALVVRAILRDPALLIIEEPTTPLDDDAKAMVKAADHAGVPLMVHENFRWQTPLMAVKDALDSGHVAGAALDVFFEEPATSSPLFGTPNFISTPHLGASTNEAQVNVAIQVATQRPSARSTKGTLSRPNCRAHQLRGTIGH